MKKAARSLSVAVLAIAAVAAVVATGWFVHAQDPPPVSDGSGTEPIQGEPDPESGVSLPAGEVCDPDCWQQASDQLAVSWQEAEQAKTAGQYADAAQRYLAIADQLPESWQAMKALLEAASCKAQIGANADALVLYDRTIALGNKYLIIDYGHTKRFGWDQRASKGMLMKHVAPRVHEAMLRKASAFYAAGDLAAAQRAVDAIRATFWDFTIDHHRLVFPLQAALTGESAETIAAREDEAAGYAEQAHAAIRNHEYETAKGLVERVLADYSQTTAALRAMDLKAVILWKESRHDNAVAVYSQILDRTKDVAPECEFARIARSRIAYLESRRLFRELLIRHRQGGAVGREECQRMRDLCRESDRMNRELADVVQSDRLVANSLIWEGRYEEAVQVVDEGFHDHYIDLSGAHPMLRASFASLQDTAARALVKMGRCQEALDRFNWIIQLADGPSEEYLSGPAYVGIWVHLHDCDGFQGVADKAAADLFRQFPDSKAAEMLRMEMGR